MAAGKGVDTISSSAELVPAIPFTMMLRAGELRLSGQRLRFVTPEHEVVLDAPLVELHSVAAAAIGLHVWHGTRRYRFAVGSRDRRAPREQSVAAVTEMWVRTLEPLVGRPPAGLMVRKPWPRWAWVGGMFALAAFFVAAFVLIVQLKG